MPLFDIIDINACKKSFRIAFAFLNNKTEDDFSWALGQLKSLYEQDQIYFCL